VEIKGWESGSASLQIFEEQRGRGEMSSSPERREGGALGGADPSPEHPTGDHRRQGRERKSP
jgi:hypothetical protein